MPHAGFEPAIPAGERLQTHALDRLATGIDINSVITLQKQDVNFAVLIASRTSFHFHTRSLRARSESKEKLALLLVGK